MSAVDNTSLSLCFHPTIKEIGATDWNSLAGESDPFIRYEFLDALETHQCVGEQFGWYPHHLSVRDANNQLVGACPLYIKTNSYGEFVFDWSWASAYEQAGVDYYPKIVCSVPYNPVTGARLLATDPVVKKIMIEQVIALAKKINMSGMHWLFTNEDDTAAFTQTDIMFRLGCQYHWKNHDYKDFDDFLSTFVSRKRKKLKRERRMVQEQNIRIEVIHGNAASEHQIEIAHQFYENTFDRKSGIPTLQLSFFKEICATMGQQVVFVFAKLDNNYVACAINLRSDDALFGRFWGCSEEYHSLHFEACFYQGIEYCIQHKLNRFEPGAQGEHKITRGFLPTKTWSAHWIAHPQFQNVLQSFCKREEEAMHHQCEELCSLSPYRTDDT